MWWKDQIYLVVTAVCLLVAYYVAGSYPTL
jgi:hypothetical protein